MTDEELELNNNFSEIFPTHGSHGKVKHKKGLALGNAVPVVTSAAIAVTLLASLPAKKPYILPAYPGPVYTAPAAFNPAPYPTMPLPSAPEPSLSPEVTPEVTPEVAPEVTPEAAPEVMPYIPTYDYDDTPANPTPVDPTPVSPEPKTNQEPTIPEPSLRNSPESNYVALAFDISMNDLEGGQATAKIQHMVDGSYADVPVSTPSDTPSASYSGSGSSWSGMVGYTGTAPSDTRGWIEWVRLVIDYTFPDGKTGQYISQEQPAFFGSYVIDTSGSYYSDGTGMYFEYEFVLDPSLVDTSISASPVLYYSEDPTDIPGTQFSGFSLYDTEIASDGDIYYRFYYKLPDTYPTPGPVPVYFTLLPNFSYPISGGTWKADTRATVTYGG